MECNRKILIIGLSSIGDNLLISPAIRLIKDRCGNASIDIVVGPRAIAFVEGNPTFSKYYVWDKRTGILNLITNDWKHRVRILLLISGIH